MKTLYIYWPKGGWDGVYVLLTKDWYVMCSHLCSHVGFASSDLLNGRPERKEKWKEYLKGWYELIVADEDKKIELTQLNKDNFAKDGSIDKYKKEVLGVKEDRSE